MSIIRDGLLSADLDVPVVLPTLNLDFANSQELDPRITFTRGSIGTRVNRNGLIETVAANTPRFDFDPISGECKGLLIEESRTNLVTYSGIPSTSWGTINSAIITYNSSTSPDGTTNATKIAAPSLVSGVYAFTPTLTSGTIYTYSLFVKAVSGSNTIYFGTDAGTNATVQVNTSTGVSSLNSGSPTNITSKSYPNSWYRVSFTFTASATATHSFVIYNLTANANTWLAWGPQVEAGVVETTYIPTSGSQVTRSADLVEMTGTNFSSWYNQTEGTFFYDGTLPFITNDTVGRLAFGVSNGFSFANSMYAGKGSTNISLTFNVINNGVNVSPFTSLPNMTSSKIKIITSIAPNNFYSCGYGGVVNKHSRPSSAIPTVTRLTLGREPWNTSPLNSIIGCINKFAYYPKALSPAQLQYLTQ